MLSYLTDVASRPVPSVPSSWPVPSLLTVAAFHPVPSRFIPSLPSQELKSTVGVVDHGIFAGFTTAVIVAGKDGVRVAGQGGEKPWW